MKISVIIFCYNEAPDIERVIDETYHFLVTAGYTFEIIVVNDGSQDDTKTVLEDICFKVPYLLVINHPHNKGIGEALLSGYNAATMEYVCAIPGDGQFDIFELKNVPPFSGEVYYSFYRPNPSYSLYRKTLTRLNRLFNQHILGVYLRDVNWVKVYRKNQLEMISPQLRSSLIESEICSKLYKLGIMPVELPSKYLKRNSGASKGGSWRTLKFVLSEVFKLWWVVRTFKSNPDGQLNN